MPRLFGDDLASPLRQADLVTLQLEPRRIRPLSGRHNDDGNAELTPSGFDLGRTLPQMREFVHSRLVGRSAEARGLCEATYARRQGSRRWAKRDAEKSKNPKGREQGYERSDSRNVGVLILMRSVDQHECGNPLGALGCEDPHDETPDRGADKDHGSGDASAVKQLCKLVCHSAGCARRRPRIAVAHSRSVVRADLRESGNLRLNETPIRAGTSESGLKND